MSNIIEASNSINNSLRELRRARRRQPVGNAEWSKITDLMRVFNAELDKLAGIDGADPYRSLTQEFRNAEAQIKEIIDNQKELIGLAAQASKVVSALTSTLSLIG